MAELIVLFSLALVVAGVVGCLLFYQASEASGDEYW
jgi:hypothetical protein